MEIGKIHKTLPQLFESHPQFDVAVVNSPRNGLGPQCIEQVSKFSPRSIVHIASFNDHLLDDLKSFAHHQYRAVFVEPFDTHPGTPYFEVLCYLIRR